MKVAIVGTSHNMTENEERDARQQCAFTLKGYDPTDTEIISGGAKGIDTMAKEIAKGLGFRVIEYIPKSKDWDSYKERNERIAQECDDIFCITIPYYINSGRTKCYHHVPIADHQKTGGCWTIRRAKQLGKNTGLLVTPRRGSSVPDYSPLNKLEQIENA